MGSKNYAYETRKTDTKEVASRCTKIRRLNLSGEINNTMNIDLMCDYVHKLQQQKKSLDYGPSVPLGHLRGPEDSESKRHPSCLQQLATINASTTRLLLLTGYGPLG